jgi:thioredoxin 1
LYNNQKGDGMIQKKFNAQAIRACSLALSLFAAPAWAEIVQINTEESYNALLKEKKPALIQFSAEWCGVCQGVKKPFEEIAEEPEFKNITFARVNIDDLQEVSQQSGIMGIPTFIYTKDGKTSDKTVGVRSMLAFKDEMRDSIRKNFMTEELAKEMQEELPMPQEIKDMMPEQTQETPATAPAQENGGIMSSIMQFISGLLCAIKGLLKSVIDFVKGLFGR